MAAAAKGYGNVALTLINSGANPDQEDVNGEAALVHAYKEKRHKMMKLLIQNKANPDALDEGGRTVLMRAAAEGEVEVVHLLCSLDLTSPHNESHSSRHPDAGCSNSRWISVCIACPAPIR
jgi:ankyrin repeat protein